MRCPCEDHAEVLHRTALTTRPISPTLAGGRRAFEAGHLACYVAYTASTLAALKSLPRATHDRLEQLVDRPPREVARILAAEGLPLPGTVKTLLARVREDLDGRARWACNTAAGTAVLLGDPARVRAAIRAELRRRGRRATVSGSR